MEGRRLIFVLNKSDMLTEPEIDSRVDHLDIKDKRWVATSALTGQNMEPLQELIFLTSKAVSVQ